MLSDVAATNEPELVELVFSHFAYGGAAIWQKCVWHPKNAIFCNEHEPCINLKIVVRNRDDAIVIMLEREGWMDRQSVCALSKTCPVTRILCLSLY